MKEEEHDELARLLEADLRELVEQAFPHNKAVTEAKIRSMATIMRRWLIDGDLQKLLDPLKTSALFYVQGNELAKRYIDSCNPFTYFLTAGIRMNGKPISFLYDCPKAPSDIDVSFVSEKPIRLTLKKFLRQPRMYHCGNWFTTNQILRFAANKLGGNHLDFKRDGDWEALESAHNYFKFGGPELEHPPGTSQRYLIIEPDSPDIISGIHIEVIAAAASFVQMSFNGSPLLELESKSTLLNKLRNMLRRKEPFKLISN